jgi:hypothetical protein
MIDNLDLIRLEVVYPELAYNPELESQLKPEPQTEWLF